MAKLIWGALDYTASLRSSCRRGAATCQIPRARDKWRTGLHLDIPRYNKVSQGCFWEAFPEIYGTKKSWIDVSFTEHEGKGSCQRVLLIASMIRSRLTQSKFPYSLLGGSTRESRLRWGGLKQCHYYWNMVLCRECVCVCMGVFECWIAMNQAM